MNREIDLIYSFESPSFFYPKGTHLRTTLVELPKNLFKNPMISVTNLSKLFLDPDHTQHLVEQYMDFFTYTDTQFSDFLSSYIPSMFENAFDHYYETKYGMSRKEINERVKVQSTREKEDDDLYELNWLLYTRKDPMTQFMYSRDKNLRKDPNDVLRWDLTSLIGNTIIGGMISRLVHEYVYSNSKNKVTLDAVKEELIEYKEWLLDNSFVMSDRVHNLWKEYI